MNTRENIVRDYEGRNINRWGLNISEEVFKGKTDTSALESWVQFQRENQISNIIAHVNQIYDVWTI